jgi:DNA polymerase elongation subunit (family B)
MDPENGVSSTADIILKPFSWEQDIRKGTEVSHILAWCRARQPDPNCYLLRIKFYSMFWLELPPFVGSTHKDWTEEDAQEIFDWLQRKYGDLGPISYQFCQKRKLYFYNGTRRFPMMCLFFNNQECMEDVAKLFNRPVFVEKDVWITDKYGRRSQKRIKLFSPSQYMPASIAFKVWEANPKKISNIRKMLSCLDLGFTQWFRFSGREVFGDERMAIDDGKIREFYIDNFADIKPIPIMETSSWITTPTIMSWDIETYAFNHNAMPHSSNATDKSYIITCVTQVFEQPETRQRFSIVFSNDDVVAANIQTARKGVVIHATDEIDLIEKFCDVIATTNPDLLIGYNILGFDWPYLNSRLLRMGFSWKNMSRLKNFTPRLESREWKSDAYGYVVVNDLIVPGRLSGVDLLPIIKRDYRLSNYDLDTVSREFIGRGKHPMTAKRMFEIRENLYTVYELMRTQVSAVTHQFDDDDVLYESILRYLYRLTGNENRRPPTSQMLELRQEIMRRISTEKREKMFRYALSEFMKVVNYAVEDSENVIDIFERLKIWYGLNELSNIEGVTIPEIFTSGQTPRAISTTYHKCFMSNIVMTKEDMPKIPYRGALVQNPVPGIYANLICLDFASLYPSIMIAYNLCWTTFVPKERWSLVPIEQCHVFKWQDEVEDDKGVMKLYDHEYRVVKAEFCKGILPEIVDSLLTQRRFVNKELLPKAVTETEKTVLDKRQWGYKISANSKYGMLGAGFGMLSAMALAAIVTYLGRVSVTLANEKAQEKFSTKLIYGDTDSVFLDAGITDPKTANALGKLFSDEISKYFPPPMKLEFEKAMATVLLLGPKMYAAIFLDAKGHPKIYSVNNMITHSLLYRENGKKISSYNELESLAKRGEPVFNRDQQRVEIVLPDDKKAHQDYLYQIILAHCLVYDESGNSVYDLRDKLYSKPVWFSAPKRQYFYTRGRVVEGDITFAGHHTKSSAQTGEDHFVEERGDPIVDSKIFLIKGIPLARRDKCGFHIKIYRQVLTTILMKGLLCSGDWRERVSRLKTGMLSMLNTPFRYDKKWLNNELAYLCQYMNKSTFDIMSTIKNLCARQVSYKDLLFIRSVSETYKNDTYFMKLFADNMRNQGQIIQGGDRLSYVVVSVHNPQPIPGRTDGKTTNELLGLKLRTQEVYLRNLESECPEPIDSEYYITHAMQDSIDKLHYTGFTEELELMEAYYTYIGRSTRESKHSESRVLRSRPVKKMIKQTAKWLKIRNNALQFMPVFANHMRTKMGLSNLSM